MLRPFAVPDTLMSVHVLPTKVYVAIFVALIFLTAVTVQAAYFDLGVLNVFLALTIAVTKAILVILYFMHVKYSSRLTRVVVGAGFFWLFLLIGMTMTDFLSRGPLSFPRGW